ncbi:hypothetical protein V7266_25535 [Neobacillus drentensis]|uniref:hypothetical protein n=1 Tax=Neobacillus drentensis TaxID=220684 RepID=UPI002FFDDFDB
MKKKLLIGLLSALILLCGAVVAVAAKNKDIQTEQPGTSPSKSQDLQTLDDSKNRLSTKPKDDSINHDLNDDSKNRQVVRRNDDGMNHDQFDDSKNRTDDNKHQGHDDGPDHDRYDDSH